MSGAVFAFRMFLRAARRGVFWILQDDDNTGTCSIDEIHGIQTDYSNSLVFQNIA